jgi:hypothetical protein
MQFSPKAVKEADAPPQRMPPSRCGVAPTGRPSLAERVTESVLAHPILRWSLTGPVRTGEPGRFHRLASGRG